MKDLVWVEKYRPKTLADLILPERLSKQFQSYIKQGGLPNLLFVGPPGTGKTTAVQALINDLGGEALHINTSLEGNIDTLRGRILDFVSTTGWDGARKYVHLGEMDHMNAQSTQPAFRAFVEEYSSGCSFIGTCNYPERLIEEIHSRMPTVDFNFTGAEKADIAPKMYKRLQDILTEENVPFDLKVLRQLVVQKFPDMRAMIGECQKYAAQKGSIDVGILTVATETIVSSLVPILKSRDYPSLRKWVGENSDIKYHSVYRALYDTLTGQVLGETIPIIIVTIARYLDMHSRSVDHEITLVAGLTEIMAQIKWA